jgi:predicted transcriptional regulator of viral defense system
MTTQSPHEVWLAVDVKARKPKTDWPPLRIVRFSGEARTFGVETHVIEGVEVRITSRAKTVADCFKYRNKISVDAAVEALREYLSKRGRSMDELQRAADVSRIAATPLVQSRAVRTLPRPRLGKHTNWRIGGGSLQGAEPALPLLLLPVAYTHDQDGPAS